MHHRIARLFEPLLQLLFPPRGRHRATQAAPRPAPPLAPKPSRLHLTAAPLRGEDNHLVRPYLAAHEQREEVRHQRARRRALWLAAHGIDIGSHVIHGVKVAA